MDVFSLHPNLPHVLTLVFGFISCLISGTLAIGEGIVFMLLFEISRSYGLFGENTSRFKGVLLSQVLSAFSQLPIVVAGRHEMSYVLGYGLFMVVVSMCSITMGVDFLLSGHEGEAMRFSAPLFMLFSFHQLLKWSVKFGEERLAAVSGDRPSSSTDISTSSTGRRHVTLDPTGTYVVSPCTGVSEVHDGGSEEASVPLDALSKFLQELRREPQSLSVLHRVTSRADVNTCLNFLQLHVFRDDGEVVTDRQLSFCIASLIRDEVSCCKDLTTLLREDSLASKMVGMYCLRRYSLPLLKSILDPLFDAIAAKCSVAAAAPDTVFNLLRVSVGKIISEISARLLELPLGIQESAAALVRSLRQHDHHHNQPLSVASAVGSIIFLRCVVPYTVDYGARNPSAQRMFTDIAAVLQKISNGAEFSSAHRLFAINADMRALSIALHTSITKTFASFEPPCDIEGARASASSDANNSSIQSASKHEIKRFLSILMEAADAHAPEAADVHAPAAFAPGSSLRSLLVYLINHSSFSDVNLAKANARENHVGSDERLYVAPHWGCISSFLNKHPSFAAAYEHFFPPISESGASVETVTVGLLLGTALSAIVATAVGAGGPPRIMAYHYLDLTKGAMRGFSWVFYMGTLLSLYEIAQSPVTNSLVMEETWLYLGLAGSALAGSQCGTYFRQFFHRRVLMYGMYLLLWANCCLLVWPWNAPQAQLSIEARMFLFGTVALAVLAPTCFFFPEHPRTMLRCLKSLFACNRQARAHTSQPGGDTARLLYGTE